jgi:hypothetical protein
MWIWVTNPAQNPATETHVFTRTFTWNHPVGAAVLKIASDNKYSVIINGFSVNETGAGLVDTTPNGTTFQHPVTYHVANTILASANSIDVSVTNNNKANAWNPAGLRYELTVYCKPANPCQKCETDADCGGGLACLDDDGVAITSKVCTSTCDAFAVNPGCAEGQTCDAAGATRPGTRNAWRPTARPRTANWAPAIPRRTAASARCPTSARPAPRTRTAWAAWCARTPTTPGMIRAPRTSARNRAGPPGSVRPG